MKKEILQKISNILDTIENTSGYAGLQELQNSSLPKFIIWYENNIQYCSPDAKAEGEQIIKLLKSVI